MAAGRAGEFGASVLLLEKTHRIGQKLMISGKGRCNLTNARELDDFISMYGPNGRFLYRAFREFFRGDLLALLGRYGVETRTERDGRVFPISDDARDVVRALERYLTDNGGKLQTGAAATSILVQGGQVAGVRTASGEYSGSAVVLATGGASYPATGSTGDGYRMAAALGHTVVKLRPALVPIRVLETQLAMSMQGVSLPGVRLTAYQYRANEIMPSAAPSKDAGRGIAGRRPGKPIIESRMGDVMITHFGLSGPATLLMSLAIVDTLEHGPVSLSIDLKPSMSRDDLRRLLQREFDEHGKRRFSTILKSLVPEKLADSSARLTGISPDKLGHQITAAEREALLDQLKSLRFNVKGPLPLAEAMVTAGGVSLKEIDPATMASRIAPGLYLCGEVIDVDAETGGYNLQAAFSTGYVAGQNAAMFAASAR